MLIDSSCAEVPHANCFDMHLHGQCGSTACVGLPYKGVGQSLPNLDVTREKSQVGGFALCPRASWAVRLPRGLGLVLSVEAREARRAVV